MSVNAKMSAISRLISGWVGDFKDLDDSTWHMFFAAQQARKRAQAPYSHFHVGVAARSANTQRVYSCCNVERASWTQTTHAEENAIDSMIAFEGSGTKLDRLVLLSGPEGRDIILPPVVIKERKPWEIRFEEIPCPCGQCLQVIWENCLQDGNVEIYGLLPTGQVTMVTIDNAFPLKFGPADLGVKY